MSDIKDLEEFSFDKLSKRFCRFIYKYTRNVGVTFTIFNTIVWFGIIAFGFVGSLLILSFLMLNTDPIVYFFFGSVRLAFVLSLIFSLMIFCDKECRAEFRQKLMKED